MKKKRYVRREIAWLSFNERVLQEAEDHSVPLLERWKFLGIFSNNMDEFFRVRVAALKQMSRVEEQAERILGQNPVEMLERIQEIVLEQKLRFREAYKVIRSEMEEEGIYLINETELDEEQAKFVQKFFNDSLRATLYPIMVSGDSFPDLNDGATYLAVRMMKDKKEEPTFRYSILRVPNHVLPRFIELPGEAGKKYFIMLDDIIRFSLHTIYQIFNFDNISAYSVKLTRGAHISVAYDLSESFLQTLTKSLKSRYKGEIVRFEFDSEMPHDVFKFLKKRLKLKKGEVIIPGGRYLSSRDLMHFPDVGNSELQYKSLPRLKHPDFDGQRSLTEVVERKDVMVFTPYHTFNYLLDLLREAALDPVVSHIYCTVYRVAKDSNVMAALINAVRNGKKVTVVVEPRARFDEQSNIFWSNRLTEEGVNVIYGRKGLKIHSKMVLIERNKKKKKKRFTAVISSGNFNELTARIYSDLLFFTSDEDICKEVHKIFHFLDGGIIMNNFRTLLVSPFNLRSKINRLINREISIAKKGEEAEIHLKTNNLEDYDIIQNLYKASKAGVKIYLNIRGICSLIPGAKYSQNIEGRGIVDRFLEHSRIYKFHNGGENEVYIGSADWMQRNFDHRVEVVIPVKDESLKEQLLDILEIQWNDAAKARSWNAGEVNEYISSNEEEDVGSQLKLYEYFKEKLSQEKV